MAMTYATVTGRIVIPGTTTGIPGELRATPLTEGGVLAFPTEDTVTLGPAVADVAADGTLSQAGTPGIKIPTAVPAGTLWRLVFHPKGKGNLPTRLGDFEITADTTTGDLVPVQVMAITPTVASNIAAAAALGATNDTATASFVSTPGSATDVALKATIAAQVEGIDPPAFQTAVENAAAGLDFVLATDPGIPTATVNEEYAEAVVDSAGRIAEPGAITTDGRTPTWVLRNHATRTAQALLGVAAFGDSMTDAAVGNWPAYADPLIPASIANYGVSGQTSTEVALRSGALDVFLTVTGNAIPASGPVSVTAVLPTGSWNPSFEWTFTGSLAGIAGTLTKAIGDAWTFTRASPGAATLCEPETRWRSDQKQAPVVGHVIWCGRNNINTTIVPRDVRAMVTAARRVNAPVLVLPVCNTADEPSGSGGYTNVAAINAELEKIGGADFYDLRGWLIRQGLAAAGITPTAQDSTDIANDIIPTSLRMDSTHLNTAGSTAVGERLAQLMTDKDWF